MELRVINMSNNALGGLGDGYFFSLQVRFGG